MDDPEFPEQFRYVFDWFWDLSGRAGSNGYGRNPIAYTEIEAWARLVGASPQPWEVQLITAMDDAAITASAKKNR